MRLYKETIYKIPRLIDTKIGYSIGKFINEYNNYFYRDSNVNFIRKDTSNSKNKYWL